MFHKTKNPVENIIETYYTILEFFTIYSLYAFLLYICTFTAGLHIYSFSFNPVLSPYADVCTCVPSMVGPISFGAILALVGIATFIAGVVMLVRAKRVLHHSSQAPPPGTEFYDMVGQGIGAQFYEEVDKQDTQTDGHAKHYQELCLAKMERREYVTNKDANAANL